MLRAFANILPPIRKVNISVPGGQLCRCRRRRGGADTNVQVALVHPVDLLHDSNRTAVTNSRVGKDLHSVRSLGQKVW